MTEYVSKETLQAKLNRKKAGTATKRYTEGWNDAVLMVKSMIHGEKAADVATVRHGRWGNYEPYSDGYRCSCCKLVHRTCTTYCPNCGAIMDGDRL